MRNLRNYKARFYPIPWNLQFSWNKDKVIVIHWIFVFPQNSYAEIIISKAIILEGGAFRSWEWSPHKWYCDVMRSDQRSLPLFLLLLWEDKMRDIYLQGLVRKRVLTSTRSASVFILDLLVSRTVRNKCLLLRHQLIVYLLNQHELAKTVTFGLGL